MEIAVAHMPHDRRHAGTSPSRSRLVSTMHSARREIGTHTSVPKPFAPGASCERRVVGVVPRPPERVALLGLVAHANPAAAVLARRSPDRLSLLLDPGVRAVELEEQRRLLAVARARIAVAGCICTSSRSSIRATGMPELHRLDHRVDGALEVANAQIADAIASGMPKSRSATSVMTPSVPSLADEEPRQVVARRRLPRTAAGPDDPAVARRRSGRGRSRASSRSAPRSFPTRASPPCRRSSRRRPDRRRRRGPGCERCAARAASARLRRGSRDRELLTSSTLVIPVRSMLTPPCRAPTWPSSEVPAPNGITGTAAAAQAATTAATSSVDSAKKTASGGADGW